MKKHIPDTLFLRLFILLFVILSLSFIAGREIFIALGLDQALPAGTNQPHPFKLVGLLTRLTAVTLTAWVAASWLSKPIKRMAQAADELGRNLNNPPIDETSGPVEVRQASAVFNQMQVRIKQQVAERNHFLAAVSHDLRTPLTRLKLRAEKIAAIELRADVQNDLNEMTRIIDTTLDYLRGDAQTDARCLFDIAALLHSRAEDGREYGEAITVSGKAKPVWVQALAIRRCLDNLIANALRYGETAYIDISETANEVKINIRDSGPGIPEDQLEAVFAPFYRLESSRSRHSGGIGLGLSIAREMARKQGGEVTLCNAAEGGLIARLILPKHNN